MVLVDFNLALNNLQIEIRTDLCISVARSINSRFRRLLTSKLVPYVFST